MLLVTTKYLPLHQQRWKSDFAETRVPSDQHTAPVDAVVSADRVSIVSNASGPAPVA
jgi:hypothetical protein